MGAYINPNNETKENFLFREGKPVNSIIPQWADIPKGHCLVCLVDNGIFTAAGIIYSERELKAFSHSDDIRPKMWFWVEKEKLYDVSNLEIYLPKNS